MISLFLILAYQRVRILEWRAIFGGIFFPFSGGRKVRGRKEGMGEGSKKTNRDQKKTNKDQKNK